MSKRHRKWRSAAARRICRFVGAPTVEKAITELGHRLLNGVRTRPTDLEAIFPRVGVEACIIDRTMLMSGELRRCADGLLIALSSHESSNRRRFTIAHEIGHAVFEKTGPYVPRRGHELEEICDRIAVELLIPEWELRTTVRTPITIGQLSRTAELFQASLTMTALRVRRVF